MKAKLLIAATILTGCAITMCACGGGTQGSYGLPTWSEYRSSGSTALQGRYSVMGTEAIEIITDENNFASEQTYNRAVSLWGDVCTLLDGANSSLSATVTTSYIYRFNEAAAGATVEIDKTCYDVLSLAKSINALTDGYYNPAVYQSVRLYGFGDDFKPLTSLPDQTAVEAYRELASHFSELTLTEENGRYYATKPQFTVEVGGVTQSLKVDLGGIGKGWCTDRVQELTVEAGFPYGYFNFGSSSIALNKYLSNEDNSYSLSSRDPRNVGDSYFSIRVKDIRLSTSADYEQYYVLDGVRYCHIIDPATGSPIAKGVASATVIGGDAAEDDALTTALCAMDRDTAVEFINQKLSDRVVVMLIFEDGQGKVITNAPGKIEIVNKSYTLINGVEDGKIVLN